MPGCKFRISPKPDEVVLVRFLVGICELFRRKNKELLFKTLVQNKDLDKALTVITPMVKRGLMPNDVNARLISKIFIFWAESRKKQGAWTEAWLILDALSEAQWPVQPQELLLIEKAECDIATGRLLPGQAALIVAKHNLPPGALLERTNLLLERVNHSIAQDQQPKVMSKNQKQ